MREQAALKFKLSARAQHKILRLARTIADLSQDGRVDRVPAPQRLGELLRDTLKTV